MADKPTPGEFKTSLMGFQKAQVLAYIDELSAKALESQKQQEEAAEALRKELENAKADNDVLLEKTKEVCDRLTSEEKRAGEAESRARAISEQLLHMEETANGYKSRLFTKEQETVVLRADNARLTEQLEQQHRQLEQALADLEAARAEGEEKARQGREELERQRGAFEEEKQAGLRQMEEEKEAARLQMEQQRQAAERQLELEKARFDQTRRTQQESARQSAQQMADTVLLLRSQLEQVDRFLSQGCDVLCVNIVDRTAAAVIVDKAQEAGVPLIFFNRQPVAEDIRRADNIYYVGAQAEEAGRLQGQLVLQAWQTQREQLDRNGDGVLQYVMLEGEPGHQDALLRTEYSVKALSSAGVEVEKLASDTANWNRAQGTAKTAQWIGQFGEQIEVVFSNNDDMALGAIDAFQEAQLELPLVVGVDATAPALEAIRQGELYGTVLNDAEGIAEAMVDLALALTRGEDPAQTLQMEDEHYIWLPCQQITLQDLEETQN